MASQPPFAGDHDEPTVGASTSPQNPVLRRIRFLLRLERLWAGKHKEEITWALVFAILFAWPAARAVDPPKHEPYKIPVVISGNTDEDTRNFLADLEIKFHPKLGDVPVELVPTFLPRADSPEVDLDNVRNTAKTLTAAPDTLMVIGHLSSGATEASLPIYLSARPQVPYISTTASDDNLLSRCGPQCSDKGFIPMLQPSPTNNDQADSAVRFALQNGKRRFLIVTEDDTGNDIYLSSMIQGYRRAIRGFPGAGVVGTHRIGSPPTKQELDDENPDCALYAGGIGGAQTLLASLVGRNVLVLLSDAVIETRGSDDTLTGLGLVRFTYQNDAAYYKDKTNVYLQDAVGIARQAIEDLNNRGGDSTYVLKSLVHLEGIADARRNLARTIAQSAEWRTWYSCTSEPECVFDVRGHRQNGMFHVWELRTSGEMLDVDGWHPPLKQQNSAPLENAMK